MTSLKVILRMAGELPRMGWALSQMQGNAMPLAAPDPIGAPFGRCHRSAALLALVGKSFSSLVPFQIKADLENNSKPSPQLDI